jgi:ATP-dependent RNA helicase DeaD
VIDQYRRAHPEVPETRIAAALAALAHGETTFFEKREFVIVADEERGPRSRRERTRGPHERSNDRTHSSAPNNFESYRIELGRDHQVNPGHIVGAITNELGVNRSLIGRIKILDQFSIVELPANLSPEMWQALQKVFVLGKKMQIRPAGRSSDADRPMGTANSSGPNLDRTERHRATRRSDSENRSTERSRSRKGKFGFKNRRKQGEQIATF